MITVTVNAKAILPYRYRAEDLPCKPSTVENPTCDRGSNWIKFEWPEKEKENNSKGLVEAQSSSSKAW